MRRAIRRYFALASLSPSALPAPAPAAPPPPAATSASSPSPSPIRFFLAHQPNPVTIATAAAIPTTTITFCTVESVLWLSPEKIEARESAEEPIHAQASAEQESTTTQLVRKTTYDRSAAASRGGGP